jgi:hypothetical protein
MNASTVVRSFAALALAASALSGAQAANEVRVLLGIDPADSSGDVLLSASLAPSQSLTRVTGMRATITQTSSMSEVMRASRTVENEVIIAPAHVTASAILHAYQLLATSGQEQIYVLVAKNSIDSVDKLPGKRIYMPQQDSLRSYVAKGLLTESGVKLAQFSKVTCEDDSQLAKTARNCRRRRELVRVARTCSVCHIVFSRHKRRSYRYSFVERAPAAGYPISLNAFC